MTVARDLTGGFEREFDQSSCILILRRSSKDTYGLEDFGSTGLFWAEGGTLCVPLATKIEIAVSRARDRFRSSNWVQRICLRILHNFCKDSLKFENFLKTGVSSHRRTHESLEIEL